MKKLIALAVSLFAAAAFAQVAQPATPTQQTGTDNLAGQICASTSGTAQQTATLTPPSGQFVYVTLIEVVQTATTAPAISALTTTTTNLAGYKMFDLFPAATGVVKTIASLQGRSLKASSAGAAVTVVSNAAVTNITYNVTMCGYFAQ